MRRPPCRLAGSRADGGRELRRALAAVVRWLLGRGGGAKADTVLQDGTMHQGTLTSMEPNEGRFPLHSEVAKNPKARPVHVLDVPGHPRLRPRVMEALPRARGLVFVIDALDFLPHIRDNAEFLYELLTTKVVVKRRIPVLLLCNKMDKVTAYSVDFIRKQLEKEIDKLRTSRSSISEADIGTDVKLGVEGEAFKFTQCANRVTATEASVQNGKIADVEAFIRELVRA
eukprot:SM000023S07610  [mRNA]  locus=s23:430569:431858:- [translate_table: standard]